MAEAPQIPDEAETRARWGAFAWSIGSSPSTCQDSSSARPSSDTLSARTGSRIAQPVRTASVMQDRVRPIQETDDPAYGRKVAGEVHKGLKRTGGVRVPREFPLMDRAAIGLGSAFLRLRAQVNWHRLFMEQIEGFSVHDAVDIRVSKNGVAWA